MTDSAKSFSRIMNIFQVWTQWNQKNVPVIGYTLWMNTSNFSFKKMFFKFPWSLFLEVHSNRLVPNRQQAMTQKNVDHDADDWGNTGNEQESHIVLGWYTDTLMIRIMEIDNFNQKQLVLKAYHHTLDLCCHITSYILVFTASGHGLLHNQLQAIIWTNRDWSPNLMMTYWLLDWKFNSATKTTILVHHGSEPWD